MSQGMIAQVVQEWVAAYAEAPLKDFEGEALEEQQR